MKFPWLITCAIAVAAFLGRSEIKSDEPKPIQTATRDRVPYKIYGSDEKFNIDGWIHYSNIGIEFKDGKASFIHGY
jgi:hypothetical protein